MSSAHMTRPGPGSDATAGAVEAPVTVELLADGTALVDGRPLAVPEGGDPRRALMLEAGRIAADRGGPVRVEARLAGRNGTTRSHLLAHPDGLVVPVEDADPDPGPSDDDLDTDLHDAAAAGDVDAPADTDAGAELDAATDPREDLPEDLHEDADEDPDADPDAESPPVDDGPGELDDLDDPAGYPEDDPRGALVAALAAEGLAARPRQATATPTPAAGVPAIRAAEPGVPRPAVAWRTPERRRRRLPLVLGVLAMTLVGAAAASVFLGVALPFRLAGPRADAPAAGASADDLDAFASSAATTPGPLAGLALPPGTRATPQWAVPVAEWTRTVTANDGTVVTRTPEGRVVRLRADGGGVLWASAEVTSREQDGPWLTTVAGTDVVAVADRTQLTYWPLGGPVTSGPAPAPSASPAASVPSARPDVENALTVDLPVGATVTFVGSSPLVSLADGRTAVVDDDRVVPVTLPEGYQSLAAEGTTVLAVTSSGWLRQAAGQPAATLHPFPHPDGAGPMPVRTEAVGGSLLLTVWPQSTGTGQVVALVDAAGERLLAQVPLAQTTDLQHARLVREAGGLQTLLGPVLVNTYAASLDVLDPEYVVTGLARGHAWATRNGRVVDIRLDAGGEFVVVPFADGRPAQPVGVVTAAGRRPLTLVTAATDTGWVLAALPQA